MSVAAERAASMRRQKHQDESSRPRRCYTAAPRRRTVSSDAERWMPPAQGWEYAGAYRRDGAGKNIPLLRCSGSAFISALERDTLAWRSSDRLRAMADAHGGRRGEFLEALAAEIGSMEAVEWPNRTERMRTLRAVAADPVLRADPVVIDIARRLGFEVVEDAA